MKRVVFGLLTILMAAGVPSIATAASCLDKLQQAVYFSPAATDESQPGFINETAGQACISFLNPGVDGDVDALITYPHFPIQFDLACSCDPKGKLGKLKKDVSPNFTCVGTRVGDPSILLVLTGKAAGKANKPILKNLQYFFQDGSAGIQANAKLATPGQCP